MSSLRSIWSCFGSITLTKISYKSKTIVTLSIQNKCVMQTYFLIDQDNFFNLRFVKCYLHLEEIIIITQSLKCPSMAFFNLIESFSSHFHLANISSKQIYSRGESLAGLISFFFFLLAISNYLEFQCLPFKLG